MNRDFTRTAHLFKIEIFCYYIKLSLLINLIASLLNTSINLYFKKGPYLSVHVWKPSITLNITYMFTLCNIFVVVFMIFFSS